MQLIDRHTQLLNIGCDLGERKQSKIRLGVVLNYRFNNNVYRQFLINLDMDFCAYMATNRTFNIFMEQVMPLIERFSNINHPCPYSGNVAVREMSFSNMLVDKSILPSGQYRIDINIYDSIERRPIIFCKVFLTIPIASDARLDTAMG